MLGDLWAGYEAAWHCWNLLDAWLVLTIRNEPIVTIVQVAVPTNPTYIYIYIIMNHYDIINWMSSQPAKWKAQGTAGIDVPPVVESSLSSPVMFDWFTRGLRRLLVAIKWLLFFKDNSYFLMDDLGVPPLIIFDSPTLTVQHLSPTKNWSNLFLQF